MKRVYASLIIFLSGTMSVMANEYPTEETVRYAINCMDKLGGQTDENLYTCECRYDAIRAALPFSLYEDAMTYERNKPMPGEKGAFFRDAERGEKNYEKLVAVREMADSSCLVVKHVEYIKPAKK